MFCLLIRRLQRSSLSITHTNYLYISQRKTTLLVRHILQFQMADLLFFGAAVSVANGKRCKQNIIQTYQQHTLRTIFSYIALICSCLFEVLKH